MSDNTLEQISTLSRVLADEAFNASVDTINDRLGVAYAQKNPQLVSAMLTFHKDIMAEALRSQSTKISLPDQ